MTPPTEIIRASAAILDPVMTPHEFRFGSEQSDKPNAGRYASGEYVRDDRRLEIHYRHSFGMVSYCIGDLALNHEWYMRALGVPFGAVKYAGFSDDSLDGFHHLASDLSQFAGEFLAGDASIFLQHAPIEKFMLDRSWRMDLAGYPDGAKRYEARNQFVRGKYEKVVRLLESLEHPDLLSRHERKVLALAKRRVGGESRGP